MARQQVGSCPSARSVSTNAIHLEHIAPTIAVIAEQLAVEPEETG